jgi:hypothetical protein
MRLINFKWFCLLFNSIISQNIQYISFRSFQYLFFGGSPLVHNSLLNSFVGFISLFLVVVYSTGGILIVRYFIGNKINEILDLS